MRLPGMESVDWQPEPQPAPPPPPSHRRRQLDQHRKPIGDAQRSTRRFRPAPARTLRHIGFGQNRASAAEIWGSRTPPPVTGISQRLLHDDFRRRRRRRDGPDRGIAARTTHHAASAAADAPDPRRTEPDAGRRTPSGSDDHLHDHPRYHIGDISQIFADSILTASHMTIRFAYAKDRNLLCKYRGRSELLINNPKQIDARHILPMASAQLAAHRRHAEHRRARLADRHRQRQHCRTPPRHPIADQPVRPPLLSRAPPPRRSASPCSPGLRSTLRRRTARRTARRFRPRRQHQQPQQPTSRFLPQSPVAAAFSEEQSTEVPSPELARMSRLRSRSRSSSRRRNNLQTSLATGSAPAARATIGTADVVTMPSHLARRRAHSIAAPAQRLGRPVRPCRMWR